MVKQRLNDLLAASNAGDWAGVQASLQTLSSMSIAPPEKGDAQRARSLNEQALSEIGRSQYANAVPLLTAAVELDPANAEFRNNLGYAQLRLGSFDEGGANIARSLELSPVRASAWANLAEVLAEQDKDVAARSALGLAIYLSRNRARTLEALARSEETFTSSKFRKVIADVLPRADQIPTRP